MQENDSYGFVAMTDKSSSLSSAMFPIRETCMVLCATCISKFLGPSFSYEFLVQETWIVCQGPYDGDVGWRKILSRSIAWSSRWKLWYVTR